MKKTRQPVGSLVRNHFSNPMDQAFDCCVRIETFAELLKNCEQAESLNPIAIANAGSSILDEAEKLRDALREIHRRLPT